VSEYRVIKGQNINDVCIVVYGNLERLPQLLIDNPFIDSYTYVLQGGELINYDANLYKLPPRTITASSFIDSTLKTKQGQAMQNIFDILIQTYGRMDDLLMLMVDSGENAFGDMSANGKIFNFDESKIEDLIQYAKLKKISSGLLGFPGGGGGSIAIPPFAFKQSAFSSGFA
jgi:hypothetical protein